MTLTVYVTPDQMARLQAEADRTGVPLTDYVRRRLLGAAYPMAASVAERLSAIDAAMGALDGSGISSEDFISEKQADIAREEAHWQAHFGPHSA